MESDDGGKETMKKKDAPLRACAGKRRKKRADCAMGVGAGEEEEGARSQRESGEGAYASE